MAAVRADGEEVGRVCEGGRLVGWGPVPGRLAQLGERRLDKAEVAGSSPASPITKNPGKRWGFCVLGVG